MIDACERFEPELSSLLDDELSPPAEAAVRAHLQTCPACRVAVEQLRRVSGVLRRWDAQETRYATSNAFRNRVLARVGANGETAATSARGGRLVRFAAAAVVVLAAGAAGALVTRARSGAPETDLARIEDQLRELRERVALGPVLENDPIPDTAAAGEASRRAALAPLAPWEAVVSSIEDAAGGGAGSEPNPSAPELWEEHGDRRITREAFTEFDRYQRERIDLTLREAFVRLAAAAAPDSPETTDTAPVSAVAAFLGSLRPGDGPFTPYEQVQVWPIEREGGATAGRAELLAASDAMRSGALRVTEGATRESFHVRNQDTGRSVLILAGDVFYGGRRDRVAAEDVLLAPGQGRSVRTVASGGARRTHRTIFSRADGLAPVGVRGLIAENAGQTVIEAAVRSRVTWLASAGRYGSLDNLFGNDQLQRRADQYASAFATRLERPSVVGFAVSAGSELLGVEVFGDRATFETMGARVLRSYVLEALARPRLEGEAPGRERVVAALAASRAAAYSPGADDVTAFRNGDGGVRGHGLADLHGILHAVVFTAATSGPRTSGVGRGRPDGSPGLVGPGTLDGGAPTGPERGSGPDDGVKPTER